MKLFRTFGNLLFPVSVAGYADDERIKRFFISICSAMIVPVVLFFGIRSLLAHRSEGYVVLIIGLLLSALTIILNHRRTYRYTIRFLLISLSSLLFYELYIGGGNGSALLWFYIFPTAISFLLGYKEGTHWIISQLLLISILIFGRIGYVYPFYFSIRFITVYSVLSVLSTSLEFLRERYLNQLIQEKKELEKAFDEIRILKGMVPICSSCKKIRDDRGFWTQIESYIKTHSDIEFSHGICPECASKLFPTVGKNKNKES